MFNFVLNQDNFYTQFGILPFIIALWVHILHILMVYAGDIFWIVLTPLICAYHMFFAGSKESLGMAARCAAPWLPANK